MALTKVSTDGVKDDAITKTKIPANQIEASELADNAVDTNAIADQAVALSKLPHGTSSNDGKFLRANNGADPTFETVTGTTINNNADNRVITGSGTANTLNGESTFVYDTAENGVGIGISDPTPTASYYQGAFLHLHQAASGGNVGSQIHLTTDNTGSAAGDGSQISAYSSNLYINNQENGDTYFYNNGSSNLTIKANGSIGIGTQSPSDKLHVNGTALIGSNLYLSNNTYIASNKGIYFDGGTSSANYLDDYEQGTYNPTLTGQGGGSISIYSNEDTLSYTKVGNIVHVHGRIRLHIVNNSMSGQARLSLPFTSAAGTDTSNQGQSAVATHGVTLSSSSDIGMFLETVGSSSNGYLNITRYSQSWTAVTANQFGGTGATSNHYLAFNHTYQAA